MSIWSKIGDIAASVVTKPLDVLGINIGQDKLYSSSQAAAKAKAANALVGKSAIALATGSKLLDVAKTAIKPVAPTTSATNTPAADTSVYSAANEESWISTLAKALNLNINLDSQGKVTGSLNAGAAANPAAGVLTTITGALAKYWWILVIVLGAVLIFRPRGRR